MNGWVTNLCFHGVGRPERELEPGEDRYWIGVDLYLQVLDEVAERPDVMLSFDDGNVTDVVHGLPGLVERRMTATFFALAGRTDAPGSLSSDQLRELRAAGMAIGSHGMRHVPWRRLNEAEQRSEFMTARRELVDASAGPVDQVALPLGRYDRQVLRSLKRLGYRRVFSSDRLHARSSAWFQPRFSVRAGDTIESVRALLARPPLGPAAVQQAKVLAKRLR